MTRPTHDSGLFFPKLWKLLLLLAILFIYAETAHAQNAKGDKPVSNKSKLRENRFKTRTKKPPRTKTKDIAGRRLRTKNKSSAGRAAQQDYPRPRRSKAPKGGDHARFRNNNGRIQPSATGRNRKVYNQFGNFGRVPAPRPRTEQRPVSNRAELARARRLQSDPGKPPKRRISRPRSASRAYIRHKTINANAGFWAQKRKGEKAYTKDIADRRLRKKNYESPRPGVIKPTFEPYYGRKRMGDKPYKGRAGGRAITAPRSTQRPWKGDLAGNKVRGRNYATKVQTGGGNVFGRRAPRARFGDRPYRGPGGGGRSATQPPEKRTGKAPLPARVPGMGAQGVGNYRGNLRLFQARPAFSKQGADYAGNLKARRKPKGGGSRSGKRWNNQGQPLPVRTPGMGRSAYGYSGNIKGHRPLKGGGSVSGKRWNNNGQPLPPRTPGIGRSAYGYSGNIKARRPLKGGGSVSGRLWNNKNTPIAGKTPAPGAQRVSGYPGNIRRFRQSPGFANQGEEYTGHIKARRPLKGGGSVSGKLWNNKNTPIAGKTPAPGARRVSGFPGNIRRFQQSPGFANQGEEFTGYIKTRRPKKGGGSVSGKLWNNKETPIAGKAPSATARQASGFPGKQKRFEQSPGFANQGEEFTGYIRLKRFKRNYLRSPNQSEDAIKKARPDKSTYRVNDLQVKVKQYNYIRNPSSADDALRVREPGRSFAKASDYQGNIKMKKFALFGNKGRHPDAQFIKTNKNNVPAERDLLTNFKLWWARLFKKNDTQPQHLKEKERKPRYDKGEQGMWYD